LSAPPGTSAQTASAAPSPGRGRSQTSTWAPLRLPVFRALWAAQLGANLGIWMHTVAAQWLLVGEPHSATLVSAVQAAISMPVVLLALPAGVLADVFERRRLLIAAQLSQFVVAAALAVLTLSDQTTPTLLLVLTFLLGSGSALAGPAWLAIQPSLVPREQIPAAAALGGVAVNVARAVGPAVAGVIVATSGAGWVFAVNAAMFIAVVAAVGAWRRPARVADGEPERLISALRAGGRYVRHSPVVRRVLLRTTLLIVPSSALWALLPVVARYRLEMGASGYGVLVGALGTGAVGGAFALSWLGRRLSTTGLLAGASGVFAAAILVLGLVRVPAVAIVVLLGAGVAWLAALATLTAAIQLALPAWVRARGIASWMAVVMLGQSVGAIGWGALAEQVNVSTALSAAAAMLAAGALTLWAWPLLDDADLDRTPSLHWATPDLLIEPDPRDGPVVVTISYRVPPANTAAFVTAMQRVGRSRRRTGAMRWDLYRDGADLERFVEVFAVPSWSEHLRQLHGRITGADRSYETAANELTDGSAVEVSHLFPSNLVSPPPTDPDESDIEGAASGTPVDGHERSRHVGGGV
jgi:MFS family permease